LNYKLAFISGATSGLGEELAFLLAQRKIPLLLTARDEHSLLSLQKELQKLTSVTIFPADLSSSSDLALLIQKICFHEPDLVINNAGLGLYGDVLSFSLKEEMPILQVNVDALVQITIESARVLKNKKKTGTILNISSMAGRFIYPGFALYSASKRFVEHFSRSFDAELSSSGIRVLTSILGRFNSPFFKKARKGKENLNSLDVMPLTKTAHHILNQIEKQKSYVIIDYRYKLLQFLSYFVPNRIISCILSRKF
jgi:short-subunit dehydrogenase